MSTDVMIINRVVIWVFCARTFAAPRPNGYDTDICGPTFCVGRDGWQGRELQNGTVDPPCPAGAIRAVRSGRSAVRHPGGRRDPRRRPPLGRQRRTSSAHGRGAGVEVPHRRRVARRRDLPRRRSARTSSRGSRSWPTCSPTRPTPPRKDASARDGDVEMRVSTFPTLHGERAVVRLFPGSGKYQRLDDLGLSRRNPPAAGSAARRDLRRDSGDRTGGQRQDDHAVRLPAGTGRRAGHRAEPRLARRPDRSGRRRRDPSASEPEGRARSGDRPAIPHAAGPRGDPGRRDPRPGDRRSRVRGLLDRTPAVEHLSRRQRRRGHRPTVGHGHRALRVAQRTVGHPLATARPTTVLVLRKPPTRPRRGWGCRSNGSACRSGARIAEARATRAVSCWPKCSRSSETTWAARSSPGPTRRRWSVWPSSRAWSRDGSAPATRSATDAPARPKSVAFSASGKWWLSGKWFVVSDLNAPALCAGECAAAYVGRYQRVRINPRLELTQRSHSCRMHRPEASRSKTSSR